MAETAAVALLEVVAVGREETGGAVLCPSVRLGHEGCRGSSYGLEIVQVRATALGFVIGQREGGESCARAAISMPPPTAPLFPLIVLANTNMLSPTLEIPPPAMIEWSLAPLPAFTGCPTP
jgi:hypothetical protein